jgi:hypothetical protein
MANGKNIHGFVYPRPVLDAHGRPVRPSAEPQNTPTPEDNANTRAAFPPLGHNDPRLTNPSPAVLPAPGAMKD